MKVLLIQPPSVPEWSRHVFAFEPLALEYIGAGLKQDGHAVELLDARFDSGVEETFREMQPDAVGLTAFTVHVPWVRDMAAHFKAIDPRVFMVVGGHHATVRPADFNSPAIDAVVIGEGVLTMRELLAQRQARRPLDSIPGLALPGTVQRLTPARPYTDLDALPLRHKLGGLRRYGLRGSIRVLRHSPEVMRAMRNGHLDYKGRGNGSDERT